MFTSTGEEKQQIARCLFGNGAYSSPDNMSELKSFFDHYVSVLCPSSLGDIAIDVDTPVLRSYEDVIEGVSILRDSPMLTREKWVRTAWPGYKSSSQQEDEYVTRVVVKAAFLIDCSLKDHSAGGIRNENPCLVKWEANQRFVDFLRVSFSQCTSSEQVATNSHALRHKKAFKAWKLVKRYGMTIKSTDNLLEHLLYNPQQRTIKVFHQAAFLRAQLKRSRDLDLNASFEESFKMGTLPPRLLFETLLSLHEILFPIEVLGNERSETLLRRLVRKQSFDKEVLWVENVRQIPADFTFVYWGDRITKLYEIVDCPPPTNALVSWFERHKSDRNALTVAIAGLFLAALFGFLSFITGLLQLIIAWIAWKES